MNKSADLGAVVLAAGASTRLGRPKQLLEWGGRPLLLRAIDAVYAAGVSPVEVVLGANANLIRPALVDIEKQKILIVENSEWREGMGSSIRCGLNTILQHAPNLNGVMLTVCDQPYFAAPQARQLVDAWNSSRGEMPISRAARLIVATTYVRDTPDVAGVPAIFGQSYFAELRKLEKTGGAKGIIKTNTHSIVPVHLPELAVDVDTQEDWMRLSGMALSG